MLYIVIFFLLVGLYLYCLLGGADFGAGIIEITALPKSRERVRRLITDAIAPIWEANHIWLIIVVVILFNGFPSIYTSISVALYIPLILLLLGIVFRGTAFTFRHYDAVKDGTQQLYSYIFSWSSVVVTLFFGLVIGALVSGKIMLNPSDFYEGYIYPWLNLFSFSVGLFLCGLFSYIALVNLVSESIDDETRIEFVRKTKIANFLVILLGMFVFIASYLEGSGLSDRFLSDPVSIASLVLATVVIPFLWTALDKKWNWAARVVAGFQLLLIMGAFYKIYFPVVVIIGDGEDLSLLNSAAPEATLSYLGWALIAGSVMIFPALIYLYRIFKSEERQNI